MPDDQPLLLSDLLAQEKPRAEDVVTAVADYAKTGMSMQESVIEELIEKAGLDALELTLMYQSVVRAAKNQELNMRIRRQYGDIAIYLQEKIDEINPMPKGI